MSSNGPINREIAKIDADLAKNVALHVEDYEGMISNAATATEHQHNMSFSKALKMYPKAIGWSVLLSTAIVMEGFDLVLIGSFFAFPQFVERYGEMQADGTYNISAPWQSGLTNAALVGELLGLFCAGIFSDRFGYRYTMLVAFSLIIAAVFVPFFASTLGILVAGEFLCGVPWGVFQSVTTAYAADVCPVALRAYLTTYVNLCFVFGQLIASGTLKALTGRTDEWSYRIPFALQWMWPVPLMVGCIFAPESPWWLIRHNRKEEAEKVLMRLTTGSSGYNTESARKDISMMVYTNEIEKQESAGTSYFDCFKRTDLRRTEIACMAYLIQMVCGSSLMGYSTYFYSRAGLDTSESFSLAIGQYAIGIAGTLSSWWLMSRCGRRTLYIGGGVISFILLLVIGCVAIPHQTIRTSWVIGSFLLILTFLYDVTLGPVCFAIISEISSTRLRGKTIILARITYNIAGIVCNILTPRMLNDTAWNWGAKSGFFWAGVCLLCLIWMYFRLPEAKGRTYGELDVLFGQNVSARKFKYTEVEQFVEIGISDTKTYSTEYVVEK